MRASAATFCFAIATLAVCIAIGMFWLLRLRLGLLRKSFEFQGSLDLLQDAGEVSGLLLAVLMVGVFMKAIVLVADASSIMI